MSVNPAPRALQHVAMFMASCSACVDPEPTFVSPELPHHYSTTHLDVASEFALCEGDLARWEAFVVAARDDLQIQLPIRVELFVWSAETFDAQTWCGVSADGCTNGERMHVYGLASVVEHELVHALAADAQHDSFFSEGLAVALSQAVRFGAFAPAFPQSNSLDVDYGTAGHFVRWLLETRGPDPVLAYMRETANLETFETIMGQSLESVLIEYYAQADPSYPQPYEYLVPGFEQIEDEHWSSALVADCTQTDVRGHPDGVEVLRTLTIPTSGPYEIWSSAHAGVRTRLLTIDADTVAIGGETPGGGIITQWLEAGTHEVGVVLPEGVESGAIEIWRARDQVATNPESSP